MISIYLTHGWARLGSVLVYAGL